MDYAQNVQAAIKLSWQVLDAQAQQVAMVLGLFALAPVKAEWVAAALPEWDEEDVEDCLDSAANEAKFVESREATERESLSAT